MIAPAYQNAPGSSSLRGRGPGLLTNTTGLLSATGEATVWVYGNRLGGHAKGVKIWASALVLDPRARSGIAHVAGPELLVLR